MTLMHVLQVDAKRDTDQHSLLLKNRHLSLQPSNTSEPSQPQLGTAELEAANAKVAEVENERGRGVSVIRSVKGILSRLRTLIVTSGVRSCCCLFTWNTTTRTSAQNIVK